MKKQLLFSVLAFAIATVNFAQNGNSGQAVIPWKSNGNEAASEHFIGTINQTDLVFKANSLEMVRLLTDGNIRLEQLKLQAGQETLGLPRLMVIDENGLIRTLQGDEVLKLIGLDRDLFPVSFCPTADKKGNYLVNWTSQLGSSSSPAKLIAHSDCGPVNVGINTDNPQHALHVVGNELIKGTNGFISNGDQAFLMLGDENHYIKSTHGLGVSLGTYGQGDVMTISQINGNVGFGTTNPQYKLDVNGGGRFYNDNPDNFIRIGYNTENANIDNFGKGSLLINWYSGKNVTIGDINHPNGPSNLSVSGNLTINGQAWFNDNISLFNGSTGDRVMRIVDNNGIDVFRIMGDGKVWATEVNVKVRDEFPDYVFEENYELMPISELENYIKVEKHLPNIPTALEVKESGIDLGEMNRLLVEKIEELTLYLIEQQKQIEQQQKQINELQEKVEIKN
ncbi:MAG: hypothetical protein ACLGGV_05765 [Bacteroidia bacterium]